MTHIPSKPALLYDRTESKAGQVRHRIGAWRVQLIEAVR